VEGAADAIDADDVSGDVEVHDLVLPILSEERRFARTAAHKVELAEFFADPINRGMALDAQALSAQAL